MSVQQLLGEAMWTFVLTVGLFCLTSEAVVTCKNNDDATVDWFIIYKTPTINNKQPQLTGKEYIYIDSTSRMVQRPNNKLIDHPNGILANTLRPMFTSIRQMEPTFGYISYSDQPPGSTATSAFGHSKGVVLVDNSGDSGVWLMHSTPRFPYRRNTNFWPPTGKTYAQTFICVTLPYRAFAAVGRHLQYIGAFPFDRDIPPNFHRELIDAANQVKLDPPGTFQIVTTVSGGQFHAIAKKQSSLQADGDLYVLIGKQNEIQSDIYAQTWGRQFNRSQSYCQPNQPNVYNVESIRINLGSEVWKWKPSCDHSKWCVAKDQNVNWVCIADVNRAKTQYQRRGGALCLHDATIKDIFSGFVEEGGMCNTPVTPVPCDDSILNDER